jgi:hypothetical protein
MKIPIYSGDDQPEAAQERGPTFEVPKDASEAMGDHGVVPATAESAPADVLVQELEAALAQKT